ncbi:hypothetical protein NX059_001324 [Plenodomus lindquistii]|nr:hypothetical protein NX059_001324 [Plenodomus lindquistii]
MALDRHDASLSLASTVRACLQSFEEVSAAITVAEPHIIAKLPPVCIEDEAGRFRIWSGNCGAHRTGRASLEDKLREASHVRQQVLGLLHGLSSTLSQIFALATGQQVPWEDVSGSESDSDDDVHHEQLPSTELGQLATEVTDINTCLMRLSMVIGNPAPHDQFKESRNFDRTYFEPFDIDHVRGKFPASSDYLALRLGKANSRRRQYLSYREAHRKRLNRGLDQEEPDDTVEGTVASSMKSNFKQPTTYIDLEGFDDAINDTLSQTSYASSTHDAARLQPPPRPESTKPDDPVECPLCFRFVTVETDKAWYKHVYQDIQPYMCTAPNCTTADQTYESRHEWFQHETQFHWKTWKCAEGCDQSFESSEALYTHVERKHPTVELKPQMERYLRMCEKQKPFTDGAACALCARVFDNVSRFRSHMGKHFEEIALFALPSHLLADDTESLTSDNNVQDDESVAADASNMNDGETQRAADMVPQASLFPPPTVRPEASEQSSDSDDDATFIYEPTRRRVPEFLKHFSDANDLDSPLPSPSPPAPAPAPDLAMLKPLGSSLISRQKAKMDKDKAVKDAAQAAADAKKRGDEDKLAKLEKLILAQKDEQLKREAASNAAYAAEKAEKDNSVAKIAAEKKAAAEAAKLVLNTAQIAREKAEEKAAADAKEAQKAWDKAIAEAMKAAEELEVLKA